MTSMSKFPFLCLECQGVIRNLVCKSCRKEYKCVDDIPYFRGAELIADMVSLQGDPSQDIAVMERSVDVIQSGKPVKLGGAALV